MKKVRLITALLCGASAITFAPAAFAQNALAAAEEDTAPADTSNELVVTGSRTITNGNTSPVPVTVIPTETLINARPTSLTESVQILPVFSGSRSQVSNPSATGGVGGGNGVAAQLNLRNIGANRNLVLMDGRRVPPTSISNIVDADVIPQLLIERVDTVTGGVSAVYGSDAVTGVVNFITNRKFKGVRAYMQGGMSEYGDAGQMAAGVAVGTDLFGGRGHFTASYEYRDDQGVDRRSARDWYSRPVVVGSGTAAAPYRLITNATLANLPFGGRITCTGACTVNGQYFATDGVLSPLVNGTAYAGTANTQVGGSGGYVDLTMKAEQRMHQFYGRFDFEVSDNVRLFVLGSGTFKRNSFYTDEVQLQNITLSRTNFFLAPAYQAQIPTATFSFNRMLTQPERANAVPESRQIMFVAGLTGSAGKFDWNVAYTRGSSRLETLLRNNVNNQKLSAALDVVAGVGGAPVCYAATQAATAAAYADCQPLNLFGPTASSIAALDYILDDTLYVAKTNQDDITADIAGSPFDTWAAPVTVALSGEWRRQTFESTSAATPSMYADCTNLRYNCTPRNVTTGAGTFLYRQTFPATDQIDQSVWEVAGEVNLPLLKDSAIARSFSVNGAVRYTKYDTVGDYWTWKAGADWQITDDLRVRGTLSRDIRAPTLNDLYAPTSVVIVNNQDLLTGATNQVPSVNVPNPNLTAEIGKTKTVGVVYKPGFAPGLSFAVDYYDIQIDGAITTVQGFQPNIQNGCNLNGVALYCDLIVRNSSNVVTAWLVRPVNLAQIKTYGVDFEVNYSGQLFGQALNIRGLAAYQPHIRYIQPSVPTIDQGGVAFGSAGLTASPSVRLTGMVNYAVTDKLKLGMTYRWRNRMKLWGDPTVVWAPGEGTIAPFGQASLNVGWELPIPAAGKAEMFVNVQNLFNAAPPPANSPGTATSPGGFGGFAITDDPIGRYWTAGIRFRF
ncbi:TonB-dependent receptor [Sphingomonas sp. AOB5]|uniref:TonB-dependent receptor domain-containing protein n=1 Tax=Sphingomonas sp. AOB5 TaxID=3034017 RepID=UPI0023F87BC7|nr:TonB-dependent receptor [Sphingomonas sp. AOB5]MDF7775295.1 TonB-dependent receptor [Sphingomonas sp. AOB5]